MVYSEADAVVVVLVLLLLLLIAFVQRFCTALLYSAFAVLSHLCVRACVFACVLAGEEEGGG